MRALQEDKWLKEDLQCQVDYLEKFDKAYNDRGPVYDCVVFHDGQTWRLANAIKFYAAEMHYIVWHVILQSFMRAQVYNKIFSVYRACMDTSECGDLSSCELMASYREEQQYSTLSQTGK